jgi:predicted HTH transcriptional regulator
LGKTKAYLLWGVHDTTHEIIGTTFHPTKCKVGNELLENWVLQRLSPKINFRFFDCVIAEKPLVLMEIDPAFKHPVQFQHQPYIRIGSYKKKLKDYPEKERELWRALDRTPFETQAAMERQSADQVLQLLDCPSFFELLNLPLPNGHQAILDALTQHGLVTMCPAGGFNITNLGAILIARSINEFPTLKRKALRVVQYKGISRIETQREQIGAKGYACGFEGLIGFITAMLPANEFIGNALRSSVPMYPELAIRELVANALIHQDFFETGSGPMIELFDDRMEITNPGLPLVAVERFLDTPPKSRNEALASMMRHFGICEERGSGIDKVVTQTELFQLPAPIFEVSSGFTRTVLFSHKSLEDMTKEDRVRACYQHSCLQYVQRKKMTNTSLRERFGIDESKSAQVSRIIAATVEAGLVVPDPMSESRRDAAYIPFWSSSKELGT